MLAAAAVRPFAAREGVKRKSMQYWGAHGRLEMLREFYGSSGVPVAFLCGAVHVGLDVEEVGKLLCDLRV